MSNPFTAGSSVANNPLYAKPAETSPQDKSPVPGTKDAQNTPASIGGNQKPPMDSFDDVFNIDPTSKENGEGKDKTPEPKLDFMSGLPDDEQLAKSFEKADFLPEGSEELMNKALTGDVSALGSLLNGMARKLSAQNLGNSLKVTGKHLNNNLELLQGSTQKRTETSMRSASLTGSLLQKFPSLSGAGVKNQVTTIVDQFINARGSKTDAELVNDISSYIENTYNVSNQPKTQDEDFDDSSEQNWEEF